MNSLITQLRKIYADWQDSSLSLVAEVYDENITFEDPIHEVKGLSNLQTYFETSMGGLNYCRFEFTEEIITRNQVVLVWEMKYSHPKLKNSQELMLNGISVLKVTDKDKVVRQRDFYDMSEMLFDHVPILGSVTRHLKNKLKK